LSSHEELCCAELEVMHHL